jgi:hypothetical protein
LSLCCVLVATNPTTHNYDKPTPYLSTPKAKHLAT